MKLKHRYDAPPVGLGDDSEMEGGREDVKGESYCVEMVLIDTYQGQGHSSRLQAKSPHL